jgi:2-polyprenyl-3-methyl-5-hydroxy-6-metoxy-1,4-benzoquinol methylase
VVGVYSDSSDATEVERPSSWFAWHANRIRSGSRVLDLACGTGRHALAAASIGARVVAIDQDGASLEIARKEAATRGVEVDWRQLDLESAGDWAALGSYDAVLVFNYLDRAHMPDVVARVAPGGVLLMETFLESQKAFGWGPSSDAHLLRSGELNLLVQPLVVLHGREVVEAVDHARWSALASVLAARR